MVRRLAFALCLAPLVALPARAQIAPATTQELQQQAGQAIQQSTDAIRRDMQQNTQAQIQQRQDEQRLFSPVTNPSVAPNIVNPAYSPYDYQPVVTPPPPKQAPEKPKDQFGK
jgi:hypothetical protein